CDVHQSVRAAGTPEARRAGKGGRRRADGRSGTTCRRGACTGGQAGSALSAGGGVSRGRGHEGGAAHRAARARGRTQLREGSDASARDPRGAKRGREKAMTRVTSGGWRVTSVAIATLLV